MFQSIQQFVNSIDFFKSLVLVVAILLGVLLFNALGNTAHVVSFVMGIAVCAPSDVPGSLRHMAMSILIAALIATLTTLLMQSAFFSIWLLVPTIVLLVFFNSIISVYGFRASLVSFSGLLALILSFARQHEGEDLLLHLIYILGGGIWYLCISLLAHSIFSNKHNQRMLADCMELTSQYLRVRAKLVSAEGNERELQAELIRLQGDINEKHEKLREIFVTDRSGRGTSYFANKYILIFIELVDILEIAMSNPSNYERNDTFYKRNAGYLKPFVDISNNLADRLSCYAKQVTKEKADRPKEHIADLFVEAEKRMEPFTQPQNNSDGVNQSIVLKNLLSYLQKQNQKVEVINRVLQNLVDLDHIRARSKDAEKFISTQDYDLRILWQNLNPKSNIFRHSIRLTFTVLVGYTLGEIFSIQNAYWIILTIIVIMRPSFGLTKSRSFQRVYGTLIGGAFALIVVFLTQNPILYGTLAGISLVLSFSFIQRNYRVSAIFITLVVIFLYALIQPNTFTVIQYRVIDTVIGAGLSFLSSLFFWPSWEASSIQKSIIASMQANSNYLTEIRSYYHQKKELPTSYKLARKEAFLAIGDLNSAFQRMTQEPKSKQQHVAQIYEMVVLNHSFLMAAAALGTFIQNQKTTEESEYFKFFIQRINDNLRRAKGILEQKFLEIDGAAISTEQAFGYWEERFNELIQIQMNHLNEKLGLTEEELQLQLQEARMVSDQIKWLNSLSENILENAEKLNQPEVDADTQKKLLQQRA